MKCDKEYKKVISELQESFGWCDNLSTLPAGYQDLLNDTIMAVKRLNIADVNPRCFAKALVDSDYFTKGAWYEIAEKEVGGAILINEQGEEDWMPDCDIDLGNVG